MRERDAAIKIFLFFTPLVRALSLLLPCIIAAPRVVLRRIVRECLCAWQNYCEVRACVGGVVTVCIYYRCKCEHSGPGGWWNVGRIMSDSNWIVFFFVIHCVLGTETIQ